MFITIFGCVFRGLKNEREKSIKRRKISSDAATNRSFKMFGAGASEQGNSISDGIVRFHGKTTRFGNTAALEREHADGGGRNGAEIGPDRQRIIPCFFHTKGGSDNRNRLWKRLPLTYPT